MIKNLFIIILVLIPTQLHAAELLFMNNKALIYFSPDGGCTSAIVNEINKAQYSIYIQAYSFTSNPISDAIISRKKANPNIKIVVILDKSNTWVIGSDMNLLVENGISVFIDDAHKIAHNKIILIDEIVTITGSFNFSAAAEINNAENLIIIRSRPLYQIYKENFDIHLAHSIAR